MISISKVSVVSPAAMVTEKTPPPSSVTWLPKAKSSPSVAVDDESMVKRTTVSVELTSEIVTVN